MIRHNVIQRSPEWYALRWGQITGSNINRLFAAEKTQLRYYEELRQQRDTPWHGLVDDTDTAAMAWGRVMEDQAVANLELDRAIDIERGPVLSPDGVPLICSLDGMSDELVPLEIKCPFNPDIHLGYVANGMGDHRWQLLGGMLCTGSMEGVFMSYDPREAMHKCYYETLQRDQDLMAEVLHRVVEMDQMLTTGSFKAFGQYGRKELHGIPLLF